ncbi:MAG: DUF1330 domain-containing protein [Lysobacterales bacterium]
MKSHWLKTAVTALFLTVGPVASQTSSETVPNKPGYMVVIGNGVNSKGMAEYAKAAVPLMFRFGGKLLFTTREGETEVIEGGPFPGSIRVFEFPSLQHARDYYYSKEYQAAIPLRAGNGKIDVILADAFVPDPKWNRPAD